MASNKRGIGILGPKIRVPAKPPAPRPVVAAPADPEMKKAPQPKKKGA